MKVHRIITTIEVENDDHSMTTVELTKLNLDDIGYLLVITNLTATGNANDIKQVYDIINNARCNINKSLTGIVNLINDEFKFNRT